MKVESEAMTIARGFREWVAKQPDDREYEYASYTRCAVGQYLAEMGVKNADTAKDVIFLTHVPTGLGYVGPGNTVLMFYRKFGDLKRAMGLVPD